MIKMLKMMRGQEGFTFLDGLMVIGVSAAIIGTTYLIAKTPLTNWWDTKIMTIFS